MLARRLRRRPSIEPTLISLRVVYLDTAVIINPYSTDLFNLNFQSLEVVSRYHDPQLQVLKIYVICEI